MTRPILEAIFRHFLNGLGVFLVASGTVDEGLYQEIVGVLMTLFSIAWSFHDKKKRVLR